MKHLVDPMELAGRAQKVGTSVGELSEDAGLARSTGYHAVNGRNPTIDTVEKLSAALVKRELVLRDYLLTLHPVEAAGAGGVA